MKMVSTLLITLLATLAGTIDRAFVSTAGQPPRGWVRRRAAARDTPLKLHVALKQADGGGAVERQLLSASDPTDSQFRQHLDSRQLQAISAPDDQSIHAVEAWLSGHDLLPSTSSVTGGIIEITTTVQHAEQLLNTSYAIYSDGARELLRSADISLPDTVAPHIDFVTPTTSFPLPQLSFNPTQVPLQHVPQLSRRATCGTGNNASPSCIRQVYGIGNYTAKPSRVTFLVYATASAVYNPTDTQSFLAANNPPAAQASATYQLAGSNANAPPGSGGLEAAFETALTTQTLLGLAWPASGIFYSNGGVFSSNASQPISDGFVQFLAELMHNETVPSVVSISESYAEDQLDPAYARRMCSMLAAIGARGVTVLFSSGNNGPNGNGAGGRHDAVFEPKFPASCPWVTAVGGTTDLGDEKGATSQTLDAFTKTFYAASGGGFSGLFRRPRYQRRVLGEYVRTQVPSSYRNVSGFNAKGRGIPDVSAFSSGFPVVANGLSLAIGGTSAAAPTWAAVITLLNDYEVSKGRPPLGFINPWLYSLKAGLKDITEGGNSAGACNVLQGCSIGQTLGYNVTKGWDPVTGLGSPLFSQLLQSLDSCERGRSTRKAKSRENERT